MIVYSVYESEITYKPCIVETAGVAVNRYRSGKTDYEGTIKRLIAFEKEQVVITALGVFFMPDITEIWVKDIIK